MGSPEGECEAARAAAWKLECESTETSAATGRNKNMALSPPNPASFPSSPRSVPAPSLFLLVRALSSLIPSVLGIP